LKILFLSFYYPPDLSAGALRTQRLIRALSEILPEDASIDVMTTHPNRYHSIHVSAPACEELNKLIVHRIKIPTHKGGKIDQMWCFAVYAHRVFRLVRGSEYHLVCGTSSRLMTAALSAYVARKKSAALYLDIRDIFVDTIKGILPYPISTPLAYIFSLLEGWTMKRASKINLVSEGFKKYFQKKYPCYRYSYFSNCVDSEFCNIENDGTAQKGAPLRVLYAGNIGDGQGLHVIIPELAKRLEGSVIFRLIGDGGRKALLEKRLTQLNCNNVEILPPVLRDQLRVEYQMADILFVHLHDFEAFKKVLPSKLLEYASTGKPIWAGMSGYAAAFAEQEISNVAIFQPCCVEEAVTSLSELKLMNVPREEFIEKYSCDPMMNKMAVDILTCGDSDRAGNEKAPTLPQMG